jgi:hypothetical protein
MAQILAALAKNESSLGEECGPRYEPSWDVNGFDGRNPQQAQLLARCGIILAGDGTFRAAAACSYGPFQIMYYNASGYSPQELNTDLNAVSRASIAYLNQQIATWKPTSVAAIGWMWNGGDLDPARIANLPLGVQNYGKQLVSNYIAAATWLRGV